MYKVSTALNVFVENSRWYKWVGTLALLGVMGSLCLAYWGWGVQISAGKPWPRVKVAQVIVLLAWIVGPPCWFWYEYWFIYLKNHRPQHELPADLELFKYGQDLSAKIWLAGTSAMFALYFGKDIHL
jgi:hypothetical protein